jgi:hypothetical protein
MALKLLYPGEEPAGMFDGLDSEFTTLLGGEIVTFTTATLASLDKAAADVFDGYVWSVGSFKRITVTKTLGAASRPLMIADEGIAGYGTLLGSVVGGVCGQNVAGTVIGPHTATGSGKVTCWAKPGLYAVTLDVVDTNATTGLMPTNQTLATGDPLYAIRGGGTYGGRLTPNAGYTSVVTAPVATFVSFETSESLVNTPSYLASALGTKDYSFCVFYFNPPDAV